MARAALLELPPRHPPTPVDTIQKHGHGRGCDPRHTTMCTPPSCRDSRHEGKQFCSSYSSQSTRTTLQQISVATRGMPPPQFPVQELYSLLLLKLPDAAQSHSMSVSSWHSLLFPAVLLLQSEAGKPVVFPGHVGGSTLKEHQRQPHYREARKSCSSVKAEQSHLSC